MSHDPLDKHKSIVPRARERYKTSAALTMRIQAVGPHLL